MIPCDILGLTQDADFSTNTMRTYVRLRLPNGHTLRAEVDDAEAGLIMAIQAQDPDAARMIASVREEGTLVREDAASSFPDMMIFGGDDALAELTPREPYVPKVAAPAPSRVQVLRDGSIFVPQQTVPMNSSGYPVVPGVSAITTEEGDLEEDGVGNL